MEVFGTASLRPVARGALKSMGVDLPTDSVKNVFLQFFYGQQEAGGELLHALRYNEVSGWDDSLGSLISQKYGKTKLMKVEIQKENSISWVEVTSPLVLTVWESTPSLRVFLSK